jgi:nucleoside-triphosphatase
MGKAFLITGPPGCGKTTVIRKIVSQLSYDAGGFYTQEIREGGRRVGFRLVTLDGREATMSHVDFPKTFRVGKYGVDLTVIDGLGVRSVQDAISQGGLVVIDEIGPMEVLSERFRAVVLEVLKSEVPLIGTIVRRRFSFAESIKALPDVEICVMERSQGEGMVQRVIAWLQNAGAKDVEGS